MKIDEYKKISDNVQVPDVVWEGYQNAIKQIKMEKETGSGSSVYSGCRMYCRICPLQLLLLHFKACRCEKEIINHRGLYQPGAVAKQMRNHLWSKGSSFM